MQEIFNWIMTNIDWLVPTGLLVADNVTKITPNKKDDLIVDQMKKVLPAVFQIRKTF